MSVLAVDQGTTSTRGLILRADGTLAPVFSREHAQHYPRPGWVEHDGEELLSNVAAALEIGRGQVQIAGLDNQGESCLAWDAQDGRPIGPVIVWQDDRTAADVAALAASGAGPEVMARAGLPLDPYFSASKLGWIVRQNPRARELARLGRLKLGTTDAFFRDRLTGRFETDLATASRTSLLNLSSGHWDAELCRLFGVPIDALPAIGPTAGDLGQVGGIALKASIVDQQAALYGHGCRRPGQAKITFGTGAFAQCLTGGLIRPEKPGPLPTVAWQLSGSDPVYALDGGVYAAAAAVNWARGLGLFDSYDQIGRFDAAPAIDRGLAFVPALAGLGCPHWVRGARGAWMGMALDTGKADLMQALLEGVALRTAEVVEAMAGLMQVSGPVSIDGGLSRNGYFTQFLADATGLTLNVSDEPELTARGVGLMAAEAAGTAIAPASGGKPVITGTRAPAPKWRARFASARHAVETVQLT